NSLVTLGGGGQIMELTPEKEIVWEYHCPYWGKYMKLNYVYRAYRYPYDWIPQLDKPKEVAIERVDNNDFRMPGAAPKDFNNVTKVPGTLGFEFLKAFSEQLEKAKEKKDDDKQSKLSKRLETLGY
ncbi:MAG TPA: thioredoxin, partial [Firmicutes bacterium]|nr:thioredoxin [Bacillota bacterium]